MSLGFPSRPTFFPFPSDPQCVTKGLDVIFHWSLLVRYVYEITLSFWRTNILSRGNEKKSWSPKSMSWERIPCFRWKICIDFKRNLWLYVLRFPQPTNIDELYRNLKKKNADIYVKRAQSFKGTKRTSLLTLKVQALECMIFSDTSMTGR